MVYCSVHILHLFFKGINCVLFLLVQTDPFLISLNFFASLLHILRNLFLWNIGLSRFDIWIRVNWRDSSVILRSYHLSFHISNVWQLHIMIVDFYFACFLNWQISSLFLNTFYTRSNILWILFCFILMLVVWYDSWDRSFIPWNCLLFRPFIK